MTAEQSPAPSWACPLDRAAERSFVAQHGHVNEISVGTTLEYDDWQWCVVTELAEERDVPKLGLVLLDELDDRVFDRLEDAVGCRQHYDVVKEFRGGDHEYWTAIEYVLEADIWRVLGPVHPDFRSQEVDDDGE